MRLKETKIKLLLTYRVFFPQHIPQIFSFIINWSVTTYILKEKIHGFQHFHVNDYEFNNTDMNDMGVTPLIVDQEPVHE